MRAPTPWLALLLCGCARACGLEGAYELGAGGGAAGGPASPVAHYRLDEDGGLVAHDVIGGFDGTLEGMATWQPGGGKVGGALQFDGVSGHVELGVRDAFDFGESGFSITLWVRFPSAAMDNEEQWVLVQHGNVNDAYYRVYLDYSLANGRRVFFEIGTPTDRWTTPAVCKFYFDDKREQWFLFAAVRTEGQLSLYVNGILWSQIAIAPLNVSTPHDTTLAMTPGSLNPFPGRLDDVRFYDVALTEGEVERLYDDVEVPWQRPHCQE
jgi:hypothetical protein